MSTVFDENSQKQTLITSSFDEPVLYAPARIERIAVEVDVERTLMSRRMLAHRYCLAKAPGLHWVIFHQAT